MSAKSRTLILAAACALLATPFPAAHGASDTWTPVPSRLLYQFTGSQKTPFHARWGRCAISVDGSDSPDTRMRVVITAPGRGERREIHAVFIDEVRIVHLDDSPAGQLEIRTEPMSNRRSSCRQYFFAQDGGLHNLLCDSLLFDVVRSPGGQKLLAARAGGVMEWAGDICHACGPAVAVVFRRDGRRTAEVTRLYPSYAQSTADAYRREMIKGDFFSRDYRIGAAMGYYANMAQIGRGQEARRWLKRHLSRSDDEWVEDTVPEIRRNLAKIPAMAWTSRNKIITAPGE